MTHLIHVCRSNCLHSLIQLTLPSGVSEVQPCVLEEVWGYYEEALSIIATAVSWVTVTQLPSHTTCCSSAPQLSPSLKESPVSVNGLLVMPQLADAPFTSFFLPIWMLIWNLACVLYLELALQKTCIRIRMLFWIRDFHDTIDIKLHYIIPQLLLL